MGVYTTLRNTARHLIRKYGGAVFYTSVTKGPYVPATRTLADNSTTVSVTMAVFGPRNKFMDGTVVRVGEARALVAAKNLTVTPKQGDRIVANSVVYYVDHAERLAPDTSTELIWKLDLKAG